MRKRILTMTVMTVAVIAAMTGCNKKDAGSVETTSRQEVETTTVAETTTEVETTTEAETTTEYSIENDPYFDMENALENTDGDKYCFIDSDTYVAITGAECIAENVEHTKYRRNPTKLIYKGRTKESLKYGCIFVYKVSPGNMSLCEDITANFTKIYTVPENPYRDTTAAYPAFRWIPHREMMSGRCDEKELFLCEITTDESTSWDVFTAEDLKYIGVDISEYTTESAE